MSDSGKVSTWPVRMIADSNSLDIMKFVGGKMGIEVSVLARAGERYSNQGGERILVVPKGNSHVVINAQRSNINEFWTKVSQEKTARRLVWEAANPS